MRAIVWKLHQWLGIATCAGVLLWGLTGVMHPIMSRLQPKPAQFMPPAQQVNLAAARPLAAVMTDHQIAIIEHAGLATIQGEPAYRLQRPDTLEADYFRTRDGAAIETGDRAYAEQLARHYTGLAQVPIKAARLITAFDADYPSVNRLLPVWRIDFARDDGLRAYIDTRLARLATLSDNTRGLLSPLFRAGHNWTFFDNAPVLQVWVMSVVLVCVLFSAGSGLYFYVLMRPTAARRLKGAPLKRWHRVLGVAVSLSALTAGVSGFYHLLHTFSPSAVATPALRERYSANDLNGPGWQALATQPVARLHLARLDGRVAWHIQPAGMGARAQVAHLASGGGEHDHHPPPTTPLKPAIAAGASARLIDDRGQILDDGINALARNLAARYAGQPERDIVATDTVTKFGGEYGFVFKRLPVIRVQFSGEDNPRYYIEPTTGVLAARIDDWDALEGKSFAYLHKWHFTDAGKDLRDFLLALFALGNVVVALMGLTLFIRKTRRQPTRLAP